MHCAIDVGHEYTTALSESGDRVLAPHGLCRLPTVRMSARSQQPRPLW